MYCLQKQQALSVCKTFQTKAVRAVDCFYRRIWRDGGGARASAHMRIRWEARLKTGSYAARCRTRAGRVRLEQRPVYRRTHPGTAGPGGCWQALTASLTPETTSYWNLGESIAARAVDESSPLSLSSSSLSAPHERHGDISNVAAKRVGFIPVVRSFVPTVSKTAQRQ